MIPVPEEYLSIYNDTWKRFADIIKNIYLNQCNCISTNLKRIYMFLKAAEYELEKDNIDRFFNNIKAANNLLKYNI